MKSLRNLDIFRKVTESEYALQTSTGALITLLAFSVMGGLLLSETLSFLSTNIKKQTLIDQDKGANMLQVNLDISFKHAPCVALSLDKQDSVGNHAIDIGGNFSKTRLNSDGEPLTGELPAQKNPIEHAVNNREGCRLQGHIYVVKVPGNFHISFHANQMAVRQLPNNVLRQLKMDHTLHHLSFGNLSKNEYIAQVYGEQLSFSALDGTVQQDGEVYPMKYEYYLKVTPVLYFDESTTEELHGYQYSSGSRSGGYSSKFGSVWFRYDIENITMKYTREEKSLSGFIVALCAILGGFFAVMGIVNSLVHEVLRTTKKTQ